MRRAPLTYAAALLAVASVGGAAALLPMSAADLIDRSELIFTGDAAERQSAASPGCYPVGSITLEVDQDLVPRDEKETTR